MHFFHDMATSNILQLQQDGTVMFLDTRHRVHGTPPTFAPWGTRYGCAWVVNKRVLSTARNTLLRGESPDWLQELEPEVYKGLHGTFNGYVKVLIVRHIVKHINSCPHSHTYSFKQRSTSGFFHAIRHCRGGFLLYVFCFPRCAKLTSSFFAYADDV